MYGKVHKSFDMTTLPWLLLYCRFNVIIEVVSVVN